MKGIRRGVVFALWMVLCCAMSAHAAFTVTDLNTTDRNSITDFGENGTNSYFITENYGETYLNPYGSYGGYAVVNQQGEFFNKQVHVDSTGQIVVNISVKNTSPYQWTDYHFLLGEGVSYVNSTNSVFQNSVLAGNELKFWAPNWVATRETVNFALTLNALTTDFRLDQIATTPIPAAAWLLGSGLIGLAGIRRTKK